METKQFTQRSNIARSLIYILIVSNLIASILVTGIFIFSDRPLRTPLLLIILITLVLSLVSYSILFYAYRKQPEVIEKNHLTDSLKAIT